MSELRGLNSIASIILLSMLYEFPRAAAKNSHTSCLEQTHACLHCSGDRSLQGVSSS